MRTINGAESLDDLKIDVKIKLAALWTSVMFCYIYADYFGLYRTGALRGMLAGRMGPLGPATQGVLLGTAVVLAIPAVMIFLSLALIPNPNRRLNVVLGIVYALINLTNFLSAWAFYIFFGIIEIMLTLLIVWYAWSWPRSKAKGRPDEAPAESALP
jgi:hypothetical protein